ncbi:hypothetical protein V8E54_007846 [Elaphomyces granulatus]
MFNAPSRVSTNRVVEIDGWLHNHIGQLDSRVGATSRPVLVFLFGHGHELTKGVFLGTSDAKVTIPDFVQAIGENVAVTVSSTAAGPDKLSESWPPSGSVGRNCGSIYTTALIQSLSECSTAEDRGEEIETYNEFARTVQETLVTRVDRLGGEHEISFCAQDDN